VLALIDLDGFREVNETQGRAGGDALMKSIAERLQSGLPQGALFGRFEDDEFAVVMTSDDVRAPALLAETLRAALSRPIFMEQNWQVSAGIGIAQAPADGETAEELSLRAGLALRVAKREGRGMVRRFEPFIEIEHTERLFIRRELEAAISARALEVHYQPVVAAAGGGIVAVEALARWTHPTRGAIAPSVFIPLAEQSGMMLQLGEFVLRRALADGARWPNLSIAVNLSPLQIRDRRLVDLVGAVMAETGIAPSRVVLEVTEGVLIEDPQETLVRLEALRALGVRLALDDFGTGYSSLSYLQKFPFSQLKIDRAFVASLGTTGNAGAIIQSIVTLGHALGMKVLAEGVETDEQRVLLRLAGCDEMQGFLFARPRPAEAIDKVVARVAGGPAAARQAAGSER
jgi:diguanylate cyclase (GGDEF)-like protein